MYPRTSYIIYATQRSGSTLLCEALRKTKVAGRPGEYFTIEHARGYSHRWGVPFRDRNTHHLGEDYFKRVYETATPNGVFGVKILWGSFSYCQEQIRKLEGNEKLSIPELLSTAFPQHRTIMITRRDKVRQAISWWKAWKTQVWQDWGDTPRRDAARNLVFDFQEIESYRQRLVDYERQMHLYFFTFGIEPFTVVYEDFVNDYEETTFQILDYLHIPVSRDLVLGEPMLQKQADEQTEEWVQQYYHAEQKEWPFRK